MLKAQVVSLAIGRSDGIVYCSMALVYGGGHIRTSLVATTSRPVQWSVLVSLVIVPVALIEVTTQRVPMCLALLDVVPTATLSR